MTLEEMRARLAAIETERRGIHEAAGEAAFDEDQTTRWAELDTEETDLRQKVAAAEVEDRAERSRRVAESRKQFGARFNPTADPFASLLEGNASRQQLVDGLLRANDGRDLEADQQRQMERLIKRHAKDTRWARQLLARSTPAYESGWLKLMRGEGMLLNEEERAAMAVGTNTAGGYLVPTHLDPTLILTNEGSDNTLRQIARVVTLTTGNRWNGVTTAGVTASFDAELSEVSDDTPAVDDEGIPVHMARAFVQASYEAFEDISGLESDVRMMFADAKEVLEGDKYNNGTGTGQPTGIFTALDANTNVEIVSTTAAAIGVVDLDAVYRGVAQRWRRRATWHMNSRYHLAIKALGTQVSNAYSGDLREAPTPVIYGRPVNEDDDAPDTQTTTARDNELIFGDFKNFLIVDKPGSWAVEFIPNMFHVDNNLPNGKRGWLAHWRTGSDSVLDNAFRLLQDKTSA
ncbi:phage major capsid protein [Saccharothrix texasensis]|uniref:HK97 family phage major capsid protein n=1 Tax=Saccharothrix texasensis TaxID=103734 RepID=A0A3N1H172_9PSEU|nr:phage major capsid protein [Saccharothrix texasensis]ROP36281.1 HK97 family phage major capsid protein [Saccharothrix texasensis]